MATFMFRVLFTCFVLGLSLSALADGDSKTAEIDALDLVEKSQSSEIRAAADVNWQAKSMIRLDRATVEFRKHWQRDLRQRSGITIREADEKRVREMVADLVEQALINELTGEGGFSLAGDDDVGVLRLTPHVVDLDVIAPDRARDHIGGAFTDIQARMTVLLDIYSAADSELLASTRHRLEDPYKGYMEWTTTPTNRRALRLMLERWAGEMGEWFESLRESG